MDEDVYRVLGSLPTYLTRSILNNPRPGQINAALDAVVVDKPNKSSLDVVRHLAIRSHSGPPWRPTRVATGET